MKSLLVRTVLKIVFILVSGLIAASYCRPERPNFLFCRKTGVVCLNSEEFTYCSKRFRFVSVDNPLSCPQGFQCQEDSRYPCFQDPNVSSGCTQVVTINNTNITTLDERETDQTTNKEEIQPSYEHENEVSTLGFLRIGDLDDWY